MLKLTLFHSTLVDSRVILLETHKTINVSLLLYAYEYSKVFFLKYALCIPRDVRFLTKTTKSQIHGNGVHILDSRRIRSTSLYFALGQLPVERVCAVTLHAHVRVSVFGMQPLNPASTALNKDKNKKGRFLISHKVCKDKQLHRRKSYQ